MIGRRTRKMKRWKRRVALILAAGISLAQAGSALAEETIIAEIEGEDSGDISEEQLADAAESVREMVELMQAAGDTSDADDAQDIDEIEAAGDAQDTGNAQPADDTQDINDIEGIGGAQDTDDALAPGAASSDVAGPDGAADSGDTVISDAVDGELILSIEEITAPESETETEAAEISEDFSELFEGQVSESGLAADASLSKRRTFSFENTVFTDSYGQQLSGNAKGLYDAMVATYVSARGKGEMEIAFAEELTFGTTEEAEDVGFAIDYAVQAAYDAFKYDYPEVFWMAAPSYKSDIDYQMVNGSYIGYVTMFHLIPEETYEDASEEIAAFDSAVDSAVSQLEALSSGMTMREKVKLIHDTVCKSAVYPDPDSNGIDIQAYSYSPSGIFLKDGYVVCEGYAKALKILCNKLGIECVLIVGLPITSLDGKGHMWNYVKMDNGNWYLVDATWDDDDDLGLILYDYFLAGSESIGFASVTISEERLIYTNFSGSTYTMDFAVPVLSAYSYDQENTSHTHIWVEKERVNPTCMAGGYVIDECECGEVAKETFDKTEHSFLKQIAVYNNDATCLKDGTKTIYCDYGCGTAERTVTAEGTKLEPTITINVTSIRLKKGQSTKAIKVTGLGPGDYVNSWKTSDAQVVTVTGDRYGNCRLTAGQKTEKATVTVRLKSGLSKKITVHVQSGTVKTTKISGVPKRITMKVGSTKKLSPKRAPITSVQKLRYTSSNKKVAAVSSKGKITAKKTGKAKITVSSGSKKVTVTVRVTK